MVITDNMKPHTVNGEYYVPILDHRAYLNVVEEWPWWFDNFYKHCCLNGDYGMAPISLMNQELKTSGGRMVPFDTKDGWMIVWSSEQDYLMFVLKWS